MFLNYTIFCGTFVDTVWKIHGNFTTPTGLYFKVFRNHYLHVIKCFLLVVHYTANLSSHVIYQLFDDINYIHYRVAKKFLPPKQLYIINPHCMHWVHRCRLLQQMLACGVVCVLQKWLNWSKSCLGQTCVDPRDHVLVGRYDWIICTQWQYGL